MPADASREKVARGAAWGLTALFLALLWLPTLDTFFHLDKSPASNEKRSPAPLPAPPQKPGEVQKYLAGLESYFNDHFGFRRRLIRNHNRWKSKLFSDSSVATATYGKDNWMYLNMDQMVAHYSGSLILSSAELAQWQKFYETRRDWLARRGIKYLVMVPPDKQTIYSEYLPAWMKKVRPQTKLSQFIEHMRAHSTVPVVDVREVLREGKKIRPTYLKTDTHWNMFGGYLGYREIVAALAAFKPGLTPLPPEAFTFEPVVQKGGDIAALMGMEAALMEPNAFRLGVTPGVVPLQEHGDTNRLAGKWTPQTQPWVTVCPEATGKLLVFRDSFAGGFQPFLGRHFHEVVYLWQYHWNAAFIEREKPDVVLDEMLERFFNTQSPSELGTQDALPQP